MIHLERNVQKHVKVPDKAELLSDFKEVETGMIIKTKAGNSGFVFATNGADIIRLLNAIKIPGNYTEFDYAYVSNFIKDFQFCEICGMKAVKNNNCLHCFQTFGVII